MQRLGDRTEFNVRNSREATVGGESLGQVAGHGKVSSDSPGMGCTGSASPPRRDPKQLLTRTFTLEESLAMLAQHQGVLRDKECLPFWHWRECPHSLLL